MKGLGNKAIMSRNINRLMREKNVTAKDISKDLDYPYTTVLSWINAEYYPRIDKIEAMADYFGVQKSELIEENKVEETEKPVEDDGLSENMRALIEFAKSVPEDKAAMVLRVIQSIVEDG